MRDFEIDEARYPYADMRIGDNTFIVNIPTLDKVYPHPVPLPVALSVALRLNTLYYLGREQVSEHDALNCILTSPSKLWQLVCNEAHASLGRGLINRSEYLAIQLQEV